LAAAGVALLVVATGMDLFMIGLAEGRRAAVGLAYGAFMLTAILGPGALVLLGILAARGRAEAALAGAVLAGVAYLVIAPVALLPFPGFGDPGPSALGPATVGLLPVLLRPALPRGDTRRSGRGFLKRCFSFRCTSRAKVVT